MQGRARLGKSESLAHLLVVLQFQADAVLVDAVVVPGAVAAALTVRVDCKKAETGEDERRE